MRKAPVLNECFLSIQIVSHPFALCGLIPPPFAETIHGSPPLIFENCITGFRIGVCLALHQSRRCYLHQVVEIVGARHAAYHVERCGKRG